MMKNLILKAALFSLFIGSGILNGEEEFYLFEGKHFMASYLNCRQDSLINLPELEQAFEEAVKASGATIISSLKKVFPPHGFTMIFLLSESHASIHTYPEHNACFVDLFTCGPNCDATKFETVFKEYLHPQQENSCLFLRNGEISSN
jgi:S-adenosylmethionine decarboxylase